MAGMKLNDKENYKRSCSKISPRKFTLRIQLNTLFIPELKAKYNN